MKKKRKEITILVLVVWAALALATAVAMVLAEVDAAKAEPYYPNNGLPWATVNAWDVCFREGPGKEYRVVQHWSIGAAVEVLGEQDGWVQVLRWTSSEPLWVWHEYLTLADAAAR